ncbi:hypothetical protein I4641_06460 [Waterburya agarophytonicola K14]|uniref:Response regulatory domain-containing protein n=1 Tax=Waterburya agarophytonicola KI4 TaxID=2874699 RepID=A0A964FEG3_9CYAN|nr:hypothetical protein [Waterburya agarophytonicola]MCC0176620.1 hypothetical protein [Waterburya agarophytonicola KI4]
MNPHTIGDSTFPTILIVQEKIVKIGSDSLILTLFNKVYISQKQNKIVLSWIQQNQPNLIILELNKSLEENCSSLITLLRSDWLTRDIPIVVTGNSFVLRAIKNLDYNTFLKTPYSSRELEKVVCSLTHLSACKVFA